MNVEEALSFSVAFGPFTSLGAVYEYAPPLFPRSPPPPPPGLAPSPPPPSAQELRRQAEEEKKKEKEKKAFEERLAAEWAEEPLPVPAVRNGIKPRKGKKNKKEVLDASPPPKKGKKRKAAEISEE
ncbi:hypothetical protein SLS54_007419 [Diplodia seriata]